MARQTSSLPKPLFHLLVAMTAVVVPLVVSTAMLDPGVHPKFLAWAVLQALLWLAIAIVSARGRDTGAAGFFRSPLFLFAALYVIGALLSGLAAFNRQDWLYATLRTALFVLHTGAFVVIMIRMKEGVKPLAYAVAGAGLLVAIIGLLQWRGGILLLGADLVPPYGTMVNENLFATFLFLSLPLTLYGLVRLRAGRLFFAFAALVMIAAVIPTTTRTAWTALTLGTALTGVIAVIADRRLGAQRVRWIRMRKKHAALIVLALVLAGSAGFFFVVSDRLDDIEERTVIWRTTVDLAKKHPLIGVGTGNWVQHTNIENLRTRTTFSNWIRPHNDVLWVGSETGVLGLVGYLGMLLAALWLAWRVLRDGRDPARKTLALAVLYALVGYILIANGSFPRERIESTGYLAMYLALAFLTYRWEFPREREAGRSRAPRAAFAVFAALVAAFAAVVGYYRTAGEVHLQNAHSMMVHKQWAPAVSEIDEAQNPFYTSHPNGLPLEYMRGNAYYELNEYRAAIDDFNAAAKRNPKQIMTTWWLARSHLKIGEDKKAIAEFEQCLQWWPNNIFTLPGLAIAYFREGNYHEAFRYLARYRKIYDPEVHREGYDDLWRTLQQKVGTRADSIIAKDEEIRRGRRRRAHTDSAAGVSGNRTQPGR